MAWRKPTEDDLASTLSQAELDAYRKSSGLGGKDPVSALIERTAAMVRGYCRANRSVSLSPGEHVIPEALISPAMDYAAYDILKRMPVPVGEDRRLARDAAVSLFEQVSTGRVSVEPFGQIEDAKTAAMPSFSAPRPARLLD